MSDLYQRLFDNRVTYASAWVTLFTPHKVYNSLLSKVGCCMPYGIK
nr:MAG TPA: hypothetical protein [Caudoviricetes sp.]